MAKLIFISALCLISFIFMIIKLSWIVIRPIVNIISYVSLIAAVFTITADVTRWQVGDTQPWFYSIACHMNSISPNVKNDLAEFLSDVLHPVIWAYGVLIVQIAPACVVFALIGCVLIYSGCERKKIKVYSN
ncbi:MAG: hypothetical protein TECD_00504 [Hyphomicrobiaceae bacterium hypho_1]